jgi:predicted DCC family thiol-disulfide oxidoreductase YuxK
VTDQNEEILVIVDGECDFCRRAVAWIRPRVNSSIQFFAFQTTDLKHYSLTQEECEQRVYFVRGDYRSQGAIAVADLLQETHTLYAFVAALIRVLSPITQRIYDYVAGHRDGILAKAIATRFPKFPDPLDTSKQ